MNKRQLKKLVLEYLKKNKHMSIATSFKNQPWASTVFFAYDKNLNIFFCSRRDTRHCKNISKNHRVAVTINQDWGVPGFVKGVQLSGRAGSVKKRDLKTRSRLYRARYPWIKKFNDHCLYVIKPKELYFIDAKRFGHFFRVKVI